MLIIGILITANSANATPQGTVIKDGVLTYPAGPYLANDPLLLSLESCKANSTQKSEDLINITHPEKEFLSPYNNIENFIFGKLGDENLQICFHNLFSLDHSRNMETSYPDFAFDHWSAYLIEPDSFIIPLNATFRELHNI